MRVATIVFILAAGAIAVLCIPISLALFSFLSHQQNERLKAQKLEEQKSGSNKETASPIK